jgi:hypothetical protein
VLIAVKQSGVDLLITKRARRADGEPGRNKAGVRGMGDDVLPQMPVCENDLNVASALPN